MYLALLLVGSVVICSRVVVNIVSLAGGGGTSYGSRYGPMKPMYNHGGSQFHPYSR